METELREKMITEFTHADVGVVRLECGISSMSRATKKGYLAIALDSGIILVCHRFHGGDDEPWREVCRVRTNYTSAIYVDISYCGTYLLLGDREGNFHVFVRYTDDWFDWTEERVRGTLKQSYFLQNAGEFSSALLDFDGNIRWAISIQSSQRYRLVQRGLWVRHWDLIS